MSYIRHRKGTTRDEQRRFPQTGFFHGFGKIIQDTILNTTGSPNQEVAWSICPTFFLKARLPHDSSLFFTLIS
jgi:hypothetical protein